METNASCNGTIYTGDRLFQIHRRDAQRYQITLVYPRMQAMAGKKAKERKNRRLGEPPYEDLHTLTL
jgi:hypothetical protein